MCLVYSKIKLETINIFTKFLESILKVLFISGNREKLIREEFLKSSKSTTIINRIKIQTKVTAIR